MLCFVVRLFVPNTELPQKFKNKGSYMRALVLLNLLNELGKRDKM